MTNPTKPTMGMMISSLRKENGMTQADLAEKMSVTDKAVSKWERDLSCPDVNSLPRLAELFHISMDELMQIKEAGSQTVTKNNIDGIFELVCKAVTVAMGVAVIVLSILKEIDLYTGFMLLGLGLTAAGISLLRKNN